MDVRHMQLITSPIKEVRGLQKESYRFTGGKEGFLVNLLEEALSAEYWDPKFQAWWPMLRTYLRSGACEEHTLKYYKYLEDKDVGLAPADTQYSNFFDNIIKLYKTSGVILFDGYSYSSILAFCREQCKFFLDNEKAILKKLYTEDLLFGTINTLLNVNTNRGLMCALQLYRHPQIDDLVYPAGIIMALQERLGEWLSVFLEEFEHAREFVGTDTLAYKWYNPVVLEVLRRNWSTALLLQDRPTVISPADTYSLTIDLAEKLVSIVNESPAMVDPDMSHRDIFNIMCGLFFDNQIDDQTGDKFLFQTYLAPAVPKSFFKNMCTLLHDFYWTVRDSLLTAQLFTSYTVWYDNAKHSSMTPDAYLESLYDRGFPTMQ